MIGPQATAAADAVTADPGHTRCYMIDRYYLTAAGYASRMFGYRVYDRAIEQGLIRIDANGRLWPLTIPQNRPIGIA